MGIQESPWLRAMAFTTQGKPVKYHQQNRQNTYGYEQKKTHAEIDVNGMDKTGCKKYMLHHFPN